MKTREEWVKKWRCHLAGLALFGSASAVRDSPMSRASKALDIPQEVERLLGQMFDDLLGERPATNGTALRKERTG
jgi:hypothetical protein